MVPRSLIRSANHKATPGNSGSGGRGFGRSLWGGMVVHVREYSKGCKVVQMGQDQRYAEGKGEALATELHLQRRSKQKSSNTEMIVVGAL